MGDLVFYIVCTIVFSVFWGMCGGNCLPQISLGVLKKPDCHTNRAFAQIADGLSENQRRKLYGILRDIENLTSPQNYNYDSSPQRRYVGFVPFLLMLYKTVPLLPRWASVLYPLFICSILFISYCFAAAHSKIKYKEPKTYYVPAPCPDFSNATIDEINNFLELQIADYTFAVNDRESAIENCYKRAYNYANAIVVISCAVAVLFLAGHFII